MAAWWWSDRPTEPGPRGSDHRVIVIGFDGLDPNLLAEARAAGRLPNFSALATQGHLQSLATTDPPQSPVAWSSFATGTGPGEHGVFDFLHRDPEHYAPEFSIATQLPPETLDLFGWQIPLRDGALVTRRRGEPFWLRAETDGLRTAVMRVPVTYPADPITHMLSGMGVPDLLGTQGTYTLIANHLVADAESGGRVLMVKTGEDGKVRTDFPGPASPTSDAPMTLPLVLSPSGDAVDIEFAAHALRLEPGQWSDWLPLDFHFLGLGKVRGMVRLHLVSAFPRVRLYVTPIQADPADPVLPISFPAGDAAQIAARIGRFHTLGMPEETWSMNQGHLDEAAWLDSVRTTLAEGEALLYDRLAQNDSDIVIATFVQPDRVSHMFWRGRDAAHPLHAEASDLARNAIGWIYDESDRIVGEVRKRMRPGDRLIILSDHGFTNYRRSVHLNRWLLERGDLVLKPGAATSEPLFANVDWSRTRAYALGLNGVFLNRQGREANGIVDARQAPALLDDIAAAMAQWQDPANGERIVLRASKASDLYPGEAAAGAPDLVIGYNAGYRASWQTSLGGVPAALIEDNRQLWSGDHCVASELVPGVLLASFPLDEPVPGIAGVGELIRRVAVRDATATTP